MPDAKIKMICIINTHHFTLQTQKTLMLPLRTANPQKWDCSCIFHDHWRGLVLKTLGMQQYFTFYCSSLNSCIKPQQSLKAEKTWSHQGLCLTFHLCCPYCRLRLIYCLVLAIKKNPTTKTQKLWSTQHGIPVKCPSKGCCYEKDFLIGAIMIFRF